MRIGTVSIAGAFLLCISLTSSIQDEELNNVLDEHQSSYQNHNNLMNSQLLRRRKLSNKEEKANDPATRLSIEDKYQAYFDDLKQRMKPRSLEMMTSYDNSTQTITPPPKQFFHLHHMKTGGTSLSNFISCAIQRYTKLYNAQNLHKGTAEEKKQEAHSLIIPTASLSECSHSSYLKCVSDSNNRCRDRIDKASTMNYCAPLAATRHLNWNDDEYKTPSVTMMRHPVDRVWSMYRFQTRSCFQCKSLIDVYADIDSGVTDGYGKGVCLPQITNHLTRNLLTNLTIDELNNENSSMTDEEKVMDAIHSIQYRFTVVGVIERLQESIELFSYSFPWLSENLLDSPEYYNDGESGDGNAKDSIGALVESDYKCSYPHSNSSPTNNRCGEFEKHMELPSHPDEETRKVIEEHNLLDIQVYEAALEHFELQKLAMSFEEVEDME